MLSFLLTRHFHVSTTSSQKDKKRNLSEVSSECGLFFPGGRSIFLLPRVESTGAFCLPSRRWNTGLRCMKEKEGTTRVSQLRVKERVKVGLSLLAGGRLDRSPKDEAIRPETSKVVNPCVGPPHENYSILVSSLGVWVTPV